MLLFEQPAFNLTLKCLDLALELHIVVFSWYLFICQLVCKVLTLISELIERFKILSVCSSNLVLQISQLQIDLCARSKCRLWCSSTHWHVVVLIVDFETGLAHLLINIASVVVLWLSWTILGLAIVTTGTLGCRCKLSLFHGKSLRVRRGVVHVIGVAVRLAVLGGNGDGVDVSPAVTMPLVSELGASECRWCQLLGTFANLLTAGFVTGLLSLAIVFVVESLGKVRKLVG